MRKLILAGGLAAVLAVPAGANAQTSCQRDNAANNAAGTIVGAGLGALLGSAIAGRHDRGAGVVVGGVGGAIAGNQIAASGDHPCPPGYVVYGPPPPPAPPPPPGFWRGAPQGLRERIDFMQDRVRRGVDQGLLTRAEADQAFRDLSAIRRMEGDLRQRDSGLTPADRDYLQGRLDDVGRHIRWAERADAGPPPGYGPPPPRPGY